jgi:hypothetical protein
MNRAAVIEQLKQTREILAKVLALLESSEADKFVAHLFQARKQYRLVCERPNKGKQGDRARSYLKLPSGAELGIQRRLSRLGALAADSRVIHVAGRVKPQTVVGPLNLYLRLSEFSGSRRDLYGHSVLEQDSISYADEDAVKKLHHVLCGCAFGI